MDDNEKMSFFYEIFDASLPRLAPGESRSTRRALEMLLLAGFKEVVEAGVTGLRILDIGCGNGAQTLELARHLDGTVLAVDNYQPFLDELKRRAEVEGLSDRIRPCRMDMLDLDLPEESFDLIWSEGALYVMGFRQGLEACRSLLVPGGALAVSELCWLRPDPPEECRRFFAEEYPPMTDIDANLAMIEDSGYEVVGHFVLPKSAWLNSYYLPLESRLATLRKRYAVDPERMEILDSVQMEIDIYRKYSDFYGYVFFLMRRSRQAR